VSINLQFITLKYAFCVHYVDQSATSVYGSNSCLLWEKRDWRKLSRKSIEFLGVYRKWKTVKIRDGLQYRRYSQFTILLVCYVCCCTYYVCYCSWWFLSMQSEREDYCALIVVLISRYHISCTFAKGEISYFCYLSCLLYMSREICYLYLSCQLLPEREHCLSINLLISSCKCMLVRF